ncbi:SDR family oxidoreductase [Microbacterium ulmi]|uniref:SDR family oxidoreductase n=1 Tax=Microbacterium ulmi TaxID=179095 RepID=A0A7Y2LWW4_9MICO|nr:SDR family oxidoreductase [Microbacterium ulmi]NII68212.1 NAD(P)-dependent dehydrogenase (short-subunit alcohol dehydrogenase family) [Microbacterium ulmi]NNH02310.1 SDR family oxidoreductase [Microbacterium ulmi]
MYRVPPQTGRRVVVTGANSGTGKEAARRLAGAGASVVMAVRSLEKGEQARADLLSANPAARLEVRRLDLADLSSVRAFAAEIVDRGEPLDTLVNNAGVMTPPKRLETADGFELQFGTNFLGPFLLTSLLLPRLLESEAPRVATMSSGTANSGRIRFDDLQWRQSYRPYFAYAQSKLGNLLMGIRLAALAERNGWPLLSTIAHPGYTRTNLQTAGGNLVRSADAQRPPIRRTLLPSQTVEQGAEPLLFAAADPAALQGAYYGPRNALTGPTKRTGIPRSARRGPDTAEVLWAVARELTDAPDVTRLAARARSVTV